MATLPESKWFNVRRHRVSLAGHLRRSDGSAVDAGQVWARPPEVLPEPAPQAWSTPEPLAFHHKAVMRPDGLYFFLDLPEGRWRLSGADSRGAKLDSKTVDVPPPDTTRKPTMLATDLVVAAAPPPDPEPAAP